ncbi:MAG: C25 family cysteine peptidase [Caldisericaceae bacterium]
MSTNTANANYKHADNYIILTSPSLVNSAMLFARYRKTDFNVSVVTTDDIGSSKAEDIRAYLAKHFNSGYLLIVGSEKTIPRPLMYPSDTQHNASTSVPSPTETDLYYALLGEDVDKDKDGYPGELYGDAMQIKPMIIVGRIPFDDPLLIQEVFENTVEFEKNPSQKAVLAASFISFPQEDYNGAHIFNGDGARLMQLLKTVIPSHTTTLFEKDGSYPSLYDCTLPLTKNNFLASIGDAAFVDWDAHGSSGAAYSESWIDKNGNGLPDDGYTFKEFINKTDDFKASGILFSGSCLNENGDDNLGKAILIKGASVFIGSTEISFTPSYFTAPDDGGSSSINYYFTRNLCNGSSVGKSLYDSFEYYFKNLLYKDIEDPAEGSLMNIYDLNIYGDPAVKWKLNCSCKIESENAVPDVFIPISFSSDKTFQAKFNFDTKSDLFIVFPRHSFYVDSVSQTGAIIDNEFGIVRLNGAQGEVSVQGKIRGFVVGSIQVKASTWQSSLPVSCEGFDVRDVNLDGSVDENDFAAIIKSFGKNYMDEGFNEFCDLDFNHRIDGRDLLLFLFVK